MKRGGVPYLRAVFLFIYAVTVLRYRWVLFMENFDSMIMWAYTVLLFITAFDFVFFWGLFPNPNTFAPTTTLS